VSRSAREPAESGGRIDAGDAGDMTTPAGRRWLHVPLAIFFRLTAILLFAALFAGLAYELSRSRHPPDIAESYLAEGYRLVQAGRYEEAVRRLQVAAEISQEDVAYNMLAEAEAKLEGGQAP